MFFEQGGERFRIVRGLEGRLAPFSINAAPRAWMKTCAMQGAG
jgi:hypothetical protein